MGRNYYLDGSIKIGIYNKKENIIWKIYKVLHDDFVASHISFQTLKDYFEDYDYDDIVEIYEDVSINYQRRKKVNSSVKWKVYYYLEKDKEIFKNKILGLGVEGENMEVLNIGKFWE